MLNTTFERTPGFVDNLSRDNLASTSLRRSAACECPSLSSGFDWQWNDTPSTSPVATHRFAGSIQRLRSVASQTKDQTSNGLDKAAATSARSAQPEPMHIRRWLQY